jgi:hypothetical protein
MARAMISVIRVPDTRSSLRAWRSTFASSSFSRVLRMRSSCSHVCGKPSVQSLVITSDSLDEKTLGPARVQAWKKAKGEDRLAKRMAIEKKKF